MGRREGVEGWGGKERWVKGEGKRDRRRGGEG